MTNYVCFEMQAKTVGNSIFVCLCQQLLNKYALLDDWEFAAVFSVALTEKALSNDRKVSDPLKSILDADGFHLDDEGVFANLCRAFPVVKKSFVSVHFGWYLELLVESGVFFKTVEDLCDFVEEDFFQFHIVSYDCALLENSVYPPLPTVIQNLIGTYAFWDKKLVDKMVQAWLQVCICGGKNV